MKKENYITRPKTKPSSSTKGKLNEWENGYREFIPAGTKESNRQMLKQLGDSSFYKNTGKKESSYSLHLNVDGESQDPVGEMEELFHLLTEGERKKEPVLTEGGQGRMLFDDGEHLQFWLDFEKREVCILTRLDCGALIERQLLSAQGQMNVTLSRYRDELIKDNSNNK